MGKRSLDKPLPSIFRWWKKERRRRRDWGLWVDNEVVQEGIQLLFVLLEKIRAATKQLLSRRKSRSRSGLFCRVCTTIYLQTKSMKINPIWWQYKKVDKISKMSQLNKVPKRPNKKGEFSNFEYVTGSKFKIHPFLSGRNSNFPPFY